MASRATAEETPGSSDLQAYLKSTFQHPDGLQTARNLVQAVAKHMLKQSTQHTSSITTFSDASPEVEAILSDILLFRDSQSNIDYGGFTAAEGSKADPMDIHSIERIQGRQILPAGKSAGFTKIWTKKLTLEAVAGPSINPSTYSRQTNTSVVPAQNNPSFSSFTTHSTQETGHPPRSERSVPSLVPVSSSHHPVPDKSAESEIRSIFGSKNAGSSILQGTESPYRVESPAVQPSNTPSHQQLSHRVNRDVQSESYGLSRKDTGNRASHLSGCGWEVEPTSRTQVTSPSEAKLYGGFYFSAQQLLEGGSGARAPPLTNTFTSQAKELAQRTSTTSPPHPSSYAGLATTIKGFLPVNKLSRHNKDNSSEGGPHNHNRIASQSKVTISNATNPKNASQLPRERLFYSLQSPSPPPNFETQQVPSSPNVTNLSSPNLTDTEMDPFDDRVAPRKRKADLDSDTLNSKKSKKKATKKTAKSKEPKSDQEKLPQAIFMRILEFTPPSFLSKARLISKSFKGMVDEFDSIFVNCRRENYGWDMPSPPKGLTQRQYSDLFGGKGCLEPGCTDTMSSRTHWSWAKRWCQACWQSKIIREDRALKQYQGQYARGTLTKLFECIPAGIHDSFLKPHDYNDNLEARSRQAPRLYKYYLATDIPKIINDYEALTPPAFVEDSSLTPDQIASARAGYQILVDGLEAKRNEFFASRKKENDDHMAKVQRIETAVKEKREENRKPNTENREARKALFARRAEEDLPHIPQEFVKSSKGFKAATRIFRDPGSERGWQTLKPKIEKEWEDDLRKKAENPPAVDENMEIDQIVDNHEQVSQEQSASRQRSITDFAPFSMFGDGTLITNLGSSTKQHYRNNSFAPSPFHLGMHTTQPYRDPYPEGNFESHTGYTGAANTYRNHTPQFQQMIGSTNGYQPQHTFSVPTPPYDSYTSSSFQSNRNTSSMSISAMLSGPARSNSNPNYRQS